MPILTRLPARWTSTRNAKITGPPTQSRGVAGKREKALGTHWSTGKLAPSPKHPLSAELYTTLRPSIDEGYGNKGKTYLRTQVVSKGLCDDSLAYIGKSLQKHKGCDILDINPGAGLWSSKLHDMLQPRSHILLESDYAKFKPYLDPLVDQPQSTYKIIEADANRFETLVKLVEDGHFPHQKQASSADGKAQEPNNSLLVTGTLMWDPKLPGLGFDSMAKQLMTVWANRAWTNEAFHAFGPVRMLLWVMDDDLKNIMPKTVFHTGRSSNFMQKSSVLRPIVLPEHEPRKAGRGAPGRDATYEIESVIAAMKRGADNGMSLPAHRRSNIHDFADDLAVTSNSTGAISAKTCTQYLVEQEFKGKSTVGLLPEGSIATIHADVALGNQYTEPFKLNTKKKPVTEAERAVGRKRSQALRLEEVKRKRDKLVDQGEDIYKLECKILAMKDGAKKEAELQRLQQLQQDLDAGIMDMAPNYRASVVTDLDDRLALRSSVPRLQWDDRPFEPLVMQSEEVWPANRAALVDIEPRPFPPGQTSDTMEYFQDFTYGLLLDMGSPLPEVLERMQHGGSQLIDSVPILKDPAKGGRLNMKNLRVRMLTIEMIDELCKAYREWPFRAQDADHPKYFRLKMSELTSNRDRGSEGL
jgi:transcription factor 1